MHKLAQLQPESLYGQSRWKNFLSSYWNFPVEEKAPWNDKIKETVIHASNKWIDTYDLNIFSDSEV